MRKKTNKKVKYQKFKAKSIYLFGFAVMFLLVFTIFCLYKVLKTNLGGTFAVVAPAENGDAVLSVFAISEEKITRFVIPSETLMDVSLQRGEWRMGSVWKLIESERLNRSVYSNTIIKSLNVPIDGWYEKDVSGLGLITSGSSLNFSQKLKLFFFETSVSRKDREEINFLDTSYLTETKLADGEVGFKRASEMSSKLRHYFVSPEIANAAHKVEVVNATGSYMGDIRSLVKTLETMGVHVLSVREEGIDEYMDCVISARSQSKTVVRIQELFKCKYDNRDSGNFDAVITIGEKFLNRF